MQQETELFFNDEFIYELTKNGVFNRVYRINLTLGMKIPDNDIETIFDFSRKFKTKITASVLVFDLDDTIIDVNGKLFANDLYPAIQSLRSIYTYIGLWSHGTTNHVFKYIKKIYDTQNVKFDFIISRGDYARNKSVAHVLNVLNEQFNVSRLNLSCLVDDKKSNFTEDYTVFVHLKTAPPSFKDLADTIESASRTALRLKSNN